MKKNQNNLMLLSMLFVVSLVIANVITGKVIDTGIPFRGATIVVPGAAFAYAFTFLFTDVVNEIWGKKVAQKLVAFGIAGQVLATALIISTSYLPAIDPAVQDAYLLLLGQNWVFVIGSLVAYTLSQLWDVHVFHRIRKFMVDRTNSTKDRWIWNNVSTMTSQLIDTIVFIVIAFGFGYGWLFSANMRTVLFGMILGQYLLKFLIALADTPVFYLLTRKNESK